MEHRQVDGTARCPSRPAGGPRLAGSIPATNSGDVDGAKASARPLRVHPEHDRRPHQRQPLHLRGGDPINNIDLGGQGVLGDIIGLGVTAVGVVLGVAGVVAATPVIAAVGLGLAVVGLGIVADVVACDYGQGYACGVL